MALWSFAFVRMQVLVYRGVYRAVFSLAACLDGDGRKVWLIHGGNEKLHV